MMNDDQRFTAILDACKKGRVLVLAACLIDVGAEKKNFYLTKNYTSKGGEKYTPFLIAVKNGFTQLVRMLLDQFNVNPTGHVGTLNFDGFLIEAVSPLWCASACGYLEIVRLLVDHGANLNQTTVTNSTPLRAACFHGKLSVVKYLMEHGADPNIANRYSNTCLMVSSYRGNLEVVQHLLFKAVRPNVRANSGDTALHFACESGKLLVVKALVNAGCDLTIKNKNGLTAAMVAADTSKAEIVEFFTKHPQIDTPTKINLLELLGASYANDKDRYNTEKTYHFLFLATLMRSKDKLKKNILPAVEAYNNRVECQTIQELQSIHEDQDAIHLEALIVRERILGVNNMEVVHPIVYRGAVYADGLQFKRCLKLWKRALYLRQLNRKPAHNDLLRFAEVYSQMIMLNETIELSDLAEVMESCIKEITWSNEEVERNKALLDSLYDQTISGNFCSNADHVTDNLFPSLLNENAQSTNQDFNSIQSNLASSWKRVEANLHTLLYFISIVCRVAKDDADLHQFGKMIYKFLKLDYRNISRSTLLHMAVSEKTLVDDFHVKDVCCFPNADVTKFLLSCGADPNAKTLTGNTPLHNIVQYERPISDFITLHMIITQLLENGAHFDVANELRKTPFDLATTGVAEIILKTQTRITLKCLVARAIRNHAIPYEGKVPRALAEFIALH